MSIPSFNLYAYHRDARQESPLHAMGSHESELQALTMFLVLHKVLSTVISEEPRGEQYYLPNFTDEEIES